MHCLDGVDNHFLMPSIDTVGEGAYDGDTEHKQDEAQTEASLCAVYGRLLVPEGHEDIVAGQKTLCEYLTALSCTVAHT